jgi:hypothetical protein
MCHGHNKSSVSACLEYVKVKIVCFSRARMSHGQKNSCSITGMCHGQSHGQHFGPKSWFQQSWTGWGATNWFQHFDPGLFPQSRFYCSWITSFIIVA